MYKDAYAYLSSIVYNLKDWRSLLESYISQAWQAETNAPLKTSSFAQIFPMFSGVLMRSDRFFKLRGSKVVMSIYWETIPQNGTCNSLVHQILN